MFSLFFPIGLCLSSTLPRTEQCSPVYQFKTDVSIHNVFFLFKNLKIVACLTTVWNCWLLSSFDLSLFTELLLQNKSIARYPPYYYVFHCSTPAKWSTLSMVLLNNNFFTLLTSSCQDYFEFCLSTRLANFLGFYFFLTQNKNTKWKLPCVFERLGNLKGCRQFYLWNNIKHSFKTIKFILPSLLEFSLSNSCILSAISFPKFSE